MGAGGGCESDVTVRKRCGLAKDKECGKPLCGNMFPPKGRD